jgi:hypothetical protein
MSSPTSHSPVVTETRTFNVSLVSSSSYRMGGYEYRSEELPQPDDIIDVEDTSDRSRVIRARVTRVDAASNPKIAARQID